MAGWTGGAGGVKRAAVPADARCSPASLARTRTTSEKARRSWRAMPTPEPKPASSDPSIHTHRRQTKSGSESLDLLPKSRRVHHHPCYRSRLYEGCARDRPREWPDTWSPVLTYRRSTRRRRRGARRGPRPRRQRLRQPSRAGGDRSRAPARSGRRATRCSRRKPAPPTSSTSARSRMLPGTRRTRPPCSRASPSTTPRRMVTYSAPQTPDRGEAIEDISPGDGRRGWRSYRGRMSPCE